ncbi:MAG: hypothetical protein A4E52_00337 [Pelotomaculum sp. PtaB.Bin013]|uniref:Uncharacterized protein n=1 Tax=Pelotomaculum isophthalicicum JI TaxID=947010 RepID=A0A9X4H3R8_9FIRM|nr:hypothetical protein [Pelotomaculum isophthalicicum]MDF9408208.1 hypothetical protein [Pelotomaculum isophthalicicum JI]OPX91811.1 MAG: hypothetical protein A4E52_00337 [Pelotomaculum sp. PtaB.Bin013]
MEFLLSIAHTILLFFGLVIIINVMIIAFAFLLGFELLKIIHFTPEQSIITFVMFMIFISVIYFLLTLGIYLIFKVRRKEKIFVRFFEASYLFNFYVWGLITLIGILKPYLINENVFKASDFLSQELTSSVGMIFFIALMNYTFFKNLVIERKVF